MRTGPVPAVGERGPLADDQQVSERDPAPSKDRPSEADENRKGITHSFHSQLIAHPGACGKTRVVPQNRPGDGGGDPREFDADDSAKR